MLFNSFEFFAFFAIFLAVFFSVPRRAQPLVLLAASYLFYMSWRPAYALLLALTTLVDYGTGLVMGRAQRHSIRRAAMLVALTINLGILGLLKYFDFFVTNLAGVMGVFGAAMLPPAAHFILPVGISFYTFQSIGYTLDVYYRRVAAERSLLTYAQYVSFFPQLVAGPIERAAHMLPQYREPHRLKYENIPSGLWLIAYGLFKKMCVADVVSPVVAGIYGAPENYSGAYYLIGTLMFALQIYGDFSGYSDIARGVARIMGFDLMVNFRQPYFATSLSDFWRRWHISLFSWFRDFLYIPLGGSRRGETLAARNIMIVFLASGLWHGAAWTFVIWGGLHGAGLVIERLASRLRLRPPGGRLWPTVRPVLGWTWTMLIVLVGWAFFRGTSIPNVLLMFRGLGNFGSLSYGPFKVLGLASVEIAVLGVSILLMLATDYHIAFRPDRLRRLSCRPVLATAAGVALTYYILLFGVMGHIDFIYFQF
jgi:D-alanyl-lipoteichoic acid acyltransferase DltB (MBOAT superfamily)